MGVDAQQRKLVMAGGLEVVAVPAFADNYLWLVHDHDSGETAVVDPGDGDAVLGAAAARGWTIDQVWNTHWHPDHTGGNARVVEATGAALSAPAAEAGRIPGIDHPLSEGATVTLGDHVGEVWEVPGHTLGHVALVFRDDGIAFVGDTMFAMGCGRLFEGTPEQMFASLQRLAGLPPETSLYPAHEYTLSNARFAAAAEPANEAIANRLRLTQQQREAGEMTLPTTVREERATNPFVRAADAGTFAVLRAWKDSY
jgi:hydroxyacylglutathione hydrolase